MRTRQVRAVSEIEIFMSQHWSTMVTVYIIGAAVTFVLTFVIFWMLERQSEKEEREKRVVSGILRGTGNETGQNHGQTDIFHFVGIGGGDMDRSSVHTGFYIHYVSDR